MVDFGIMRTPESQTNYLTFRGSADARKSERAISKQWSYLWTFIPADGRSGLHLPPLLLY
jgi:hypothetical protein